MLAPRWELGGGGGGEEHACKVLRCSSPRTPRTTDTSEMVAEDGVERRGNLILLGYWVKCHCSALRETLTDRPLSQPPNLRGQWLHNSCGPDKLGETEMATLAEQNEIKWFSNIQYSLGTSQRHDKIPQKGRAKGSSALVLDVGHPFKSKSARSSS